MSGYPPPGPGYPPVGGPGYPPAGPPGYPQPGGVGGPGYPMPSAPPSAGFMPMPYPGDGGGGGGGGGGYPPPMPGYPGAGPGSYPSGSPTSYPGRQSPVMHQPGQNIPMQTMHGVQPYQPMQSDPNVPVGLEHLNAIDHMFVKQKVEMLEALVGFETNNKYTIKNNRGDKMFYAVEENDCCTLNLCGDLRPFQMRIMDLNKTEVMRIIRPARCSSCCFPCCLQEVEIYSVTGELLGSVTQDWTLCYQKFSIRDATGEPVLTINGPMCLFSCSGMIKFSVMSLDGSTKVGKITKEWSGFARELFTDADYFGVSFPVDLDVKIKAVLLAATFLIDFMFFEQSK